MAHGRAHASGPYGGAATASDVPLAEGSPRCTTAAVAALNAWRGVRSCYYRRVLRQPAIGTKGSVRWDRLRRAGPQGPRSLNTGSSTWLYVCLGRKGERAQSETLLRSEQDSAIASGSEYYACTWYLRAN